MMPSGGVRSRPTRLAAASSARRPARSSEIEVTIGRRISQLAAAGGEAERRQLLVEELGMGEAVAQAAQPERGVVARRRADPLLASEVVRANHDRVRSRRLEEGLVGGALLLDAGRAREGPEVEELGAEETDPLRAEPLEGRDLLGQLEVRPQRDAHSVARRRRARRTAPGGGAPSPGPPAPGRGSGAAAPSRAGDPRCPRRRRRRWAAPARPSRRGPGCRRPRAGRRSAR